MPAAVAAGIAQTALTAPVVAGVGSGLMAGLTTGATLAGGAGIFSNFMAGAAPTLTGGLSTLAPTVATKIAPAAASQLAGTIGGSVAPGAFGANLAGGAGANLAGAGGTQLAQVAPNLIGREQILQAFSRPELGQNLTQLGSRLAGPADSLSSVSRTDLLAKQAGLMPNTTEAANLAQQAKTGQALQDYTTAQQVAQKAGYGSPIQSGDNFLSNAFNFLKNPSWEGAKDYASEHPYATTAMAALAAKKLLEQKGVEKPEDNAMIRPYTYERTQRPEAYAVSPAQDSSERLYFNEQLTAGEPYKAAEGGLASLAVGGPVEQMAAMNSVGANTGYPMAAINTPVYSNPMMQRPEATNVIAPSADAGVGTYSGEQRFATGGEAKTEGGYKYSYDPNTMQFTQLSGPTATSPSSSGYSINSAYSRDSGHSGGMGSFGYSAPAPVPTPVPTPAPTLATLQPVTNSGTKVSGGIATPAMGPVQAQRSATPINIPVYQTPEQQLGLEGFYDYMNRQLSGYAGYAAGGGVSNLGDYSDGGRLLRGPGDGVSDSIPASIGNRQPARLADGEFVIPARIVSELGNGSTEAGARKLYAMMDRVQKARKKSVGKKKVAVDSKTDRYLPA